MRRELPLLALLLVVIVVEERPVVLVGLAAHEALARAPLHDNAGDYADDQPDGDQASDAFERLEQEMVQLTEVSSSYLCKVRPQAALLRFSFAGRVYYARANSGYLHDENPLYT